MPMRAAALVASFALHPLLLPTLGLFLVFQLDSYIGHQTPPLKQQFLLGWIFINTCVIPVIFTLFLKWRKIISSLELHDRQERTVPFLFTFIFFCTNYYLLRGISLPGPIHSIMLGSAISVGVAFVMNFFTKVSIHMIGIGGLFATFFGLSQVMMIGLVPLLLVLALVGGVVGSARLLREAHTQRQVYVGWLLGFCSIYFPLVLEWG